MLPKSRITVSWEDQPDGSHWKATVRSVTEAGWRVEVILVEQKSGVAVRELRLTPASPRRVPKGGVTRRLLENIELTKLRAAASEAARDHFGDEDRAAAEMEVLLGGSPTQIGGRRRMSDAEKAAIAIRYAQLVEEGKGAPELAAELSNAVPSTRNLLSRPRREGWLEGDAPSARARDLQKRS